MMLYANGDAEAFKQLYARYEKPIYRFVYNGCQREAIAGELFQDIWLRVVNARAGFDQQTPFKSWLFTIARNRLTDQYRLQARTALDKPAQSNEQSGTVARETAENTATLWQKDNLTPEEITCAAQFSNTLRDALLTLPEEQRDAVMLKHIAGFDIKEIAVIQSTAAQTVKSRLRYAMVKLRTQLKGIS